MLPNHSKKLMTFLRYYRTASSKAGLESSQLTICSIRPEHRKDKPGVHQLAFGKNFTDHMLSIPWREDSGWGPPLIAPLDNFRLHPASKVLHYAQECFEGMKAFRGIDEKIRLFRPLHNMARMNITAKRACLPTFNGVELLHCIRKLIELETDWVPNYPASSLYIRPTLIGTEPTFGIAAANEALLYVLLCPVGPYFSTGVKPINLLADPRFVRAFPGGCGFAKMGCNYAPTLYSQKMASTYNCQQCLWLFGEEHEITEVGAMNIFIYLRNASGENELITPSLERGMILPGISRRSIIELAQERWNDFKIVERRITMAELLTSLNEKRVIEVFGAGTAAIVSSVGGIYYDGKMIKLPTPQNSVSSRIYKALSDIYYGIEEHPWSIDIEAWNIDAQSVGTDFEMESSMTEVQ